MHSIIVDLDIPADDWLYYYRGSVRSVSAICRAGKRVQFPASILKKFVTRSGVRGVFQINFDEIYICSYLLSSI